MTRVTYITRKRRTGHSQCINQLGESGRPLSLMATRTFWHRAKVGEGIEATSSPSIHPSSCIPKSCHSSDGISSPLLQPCEIAYVYNSFIQFHWSMHLLQANTLTLQKRPANCVGRIIRETKLPYYWAFFIGPSCTLEVKFACESFACTSTVHMHICIYMKVLFFPFSSFLILDLAVGSVQWSQTDGPRKEEKALRDITCINVSLLPLFMTHLTDEFYSKETFNVSFKCPWTVTSFLYNIAERQVRNVWCGCCPIKAVIS